MTRIIQCVAVATVALAVSVLISESAPAQTGTKPPVVGHWVLNRAKSTFSGNPPERRTLTFEAMPDGAIKEMAVTRQANGGSDQIVYVAREDGKDYPISNSVLDTVSLKRVDARTVERLGKVQGKVVETRTRVVSPDGKMLTITTKGTNRGVPYQSMQVFDREE